MTNEILFVAIDGPSYQPNGRTLVRILHQDDRRNAFKCEVIKVLSSIGRTSQPGDKVVVEAQNLSPYWIEP